MLQFPMTEDGNSSHDITLYGKNYTFRYKYNTRNKRIYLSILEGSLILIDNIRLVAFGLPTQRYVLEDFPPVQLFIAWLGATPNEPTLGNLGVNKDFSLLGLEWGDF